MANMATSWSRRAFLFLALLATVCSPAFADDSIGTVSDQVVSSGTFTSLLNLFEGICYLVGATFGIKSATQLRDHTYNPLQTKMSKPITSMAMSGSLLSVPSLFEMLQTTFSVFDGPGGGVGALAGFSAGSPAAATGLDGMAQAFASNIPAMMKLMAFGAICAGAFLVLRAVLMLPQVEQGRVETSKVLWTLFSGIGLWSLLPFISVSMNTIGMATSAPASILTAKYSQAGGGGFDGTIASIMVFTQFLGLVAFIRGMLTLKAMGDNKDGAMGKALFFIVGGSMALNIGWAVKMLASSIGAGSVVCGISVNLCS
jgi:hypothetical protein